jgi:acetyl-CoA C-acetyltransferase/acetyl-CoA acyltransferase
MNTNPNAKSLVLIDGVRTPFARLGTTLAHADAVELGRVAVSRLLGRTGIDPGLVSEVILGCVAQPMDAANVARVVALRSGIPEAVPAMTVQRNCASGLEALTTAAERAAAGHGDVFVVGGTESMTRIPLLFQAAAAAKFAALQRAKTGRARWQAALRFRPADFAPVVGLRLGLTDPVAGLNMGETAELLAREHGITREAQDEFALASHLRAAIAAPFLAGEIVPVYRDGTVVDTDNGVRPEQTLEALRRLSPVFERGTGTVTAGNSSQVTDGAVALLVMTAERAERLGLEPLARLTDFVWVGCDPRRMGLGPAVALRRLAERTGVKPADADVVEINEAFAAQVLAVGRALAESGLEVEPERLNPNGGAIALGHPVGASGARLVLTAARHLRRTGGRKALVSLCIGGGQGGAALLERL